MLIAEESLDETQTECRRADWEDFSSALQRSSKRTWFAARSTNAIVTIQVLISLDPPLLNVTQRVNIVNGLSMVL